jgi:hypothetical protein
VIFFLFDSTVNKSSLTVPNGRMIDEWQIGKDLEGYSHVLIEVTPRHFPGVSEENHQKPL